MSRSITMWLTRNDDYVGCDYQLVHYRDHPYIFKGCFVSTASKGARIRWKAFSAEDWENHIGITAKPGERKAIKIVEV